MFATDILSTIHVSQRGRHGLLTLLCLMMTLQTESGAQKLPGCYIHLLPSEVLLNIFKRLAQDQGLEPYDHYTSYLPFLTVCGNWYHLCQPLLFHKLVLRHDGIDNYPRRTTDLVERLVRESHLREHVRVVAIRVKGRVETRQYDEILSVITLCTNIRQLLLDIPWSERALAIFHAASNLLQLNALYVSGYLSGYESSKLPSSAMSSLLDNSSLRDLRLHACTIHRSIQTAGVEIPLPIRMKNITKLSITDPSFDPEVTEALVATPRRLEHLALNIAQFFGNTYTDKAVQQIVEIHRASLERVSISRGDHPSWPISNSMPDFSAFPALRKLHVSPRGIYDSSPEMIGEKIAAPNLEEMVLEVDSGEFSFDSIPWSIWAPNQFEDISFHRNSQDPGTRFRSIVIKYTPHWWNGLGGWERGSVPSTMSWPWGFRPGLTEKLARQGVTLTWDPPFSADDLSHKYPTGPECHENPDGSYL